MTTPWRAGENISVCGYLHFKDSKLFVPVHIRFCYQTSHRSNLSVLICLAFEVTNERSCLNSVADLYDHAHVYVELLLKKRYWAPSQQKKICSSQKAQELLMYLKDYRSFDCGWCPSGCEVHLLSLTCGEDRTLGICLSLDDSRWCVCVCHPLAGWSRLNLK